MATFGNPNYGAGEDSLEANRIHGVLYACSESGIVQSISARVAYQSFSGNVKYAVYTNASPPVLVDYTGNGTLGASPAIVTLNGTQSGSLSAASFWLCAWSDTQWKWSAYTGSGADSNYWDQTYGSWPATLSTWNDANAYDYTIYCTYVAGGGITNVSNLIFES